MTIILTFAERYPRITIALIAVTLTLFAVTLADASLHAQGYSTILDR